MKTCEPGIFYELDEKKQEKYVNGVKDSIQNNEDVLLKKMMKTVQNAVKAYETDFYVHDYAMYKEAKNHPFLWVIRPHGTHYLRLIDDRFEKNGDDEDWVMRHVCNAVIRNAEPTHVIYLCLDNKMKKVSHEQAWDIVEEYERKALSRKEIRENEEEKERQKKWLAGVY